MCNCCAPYIVSLPCPKACQPVVKIGKSRGIVCCPPPCCPPPCCPTPCCPTPCNPVYSTNITPFNCNYYCDPSLKLLYPSDLPIFPGCYPGC